MPDPDHREASPSRVAISWPLAGVAAAGLAAAVALRLHFLDLPLERDEAVYAVIAQQLLDGQPPYVSSHDMRFPGIYAAYALVLALFGHTHTGIHAGLLAVNATSTLLLFMLARSLAGARVALAAASAFAVLSMSPAVQGLWANNEHFVIPQVLGGLWLLVRELGSRRSGGLGSRQSGELESHRPGWLFTAGVLLGLAPLVKQHGLFFPLFGMLLVLLGPVPSGGTGRLKALIALALGIAAPFAVAGLALAAAGVLGDFWFWAIEYAWTYASMASAERGLQNLIIGTSGLLLPLSVFLVLAVAGLVAVAVGYRDLASRRFVIGFAIVSSLCVVPGFYFRSHYFALLLPAVALSSALGIEAAASWISRGRPRVAAWASASLLALGLGAALAADREFYALDPGPAIRAVYFANPFLEARGIADFIRERTTADDSIAVIGSEPEIYFYARRRPATAFLYTYPMMEPHPFAESMQREMIAQIEAAEPAFIVYVATRYSWMPNSKSPTLILQWAERYTREGYDRVGAVDVVSASETIWVWGEEAASYQPRSPNFLYVFERRPAPASAATP